PDLEEGKTMKAGCLGGVASAGALAIALLLGGCRIPTTSISTVLRNAGKLNGTVVTVRGRVRAGAALFGTGAYQLADGSGKIWVLTRGGAPPGNTTAMVDGKVRQVLQVGPLHVAGLEEINRY